MLTTLKIVNWEEEPDLTKLWKRDQDYSWHTLAVINDYYKNRDGYYIVEMKDDGNIVVFEIYELP